MARVTYPDFDSASCALKFGNTEVFTIAQTS
jgi:hypothetical protein